MKRLNKLIRQEAKLKSQVYMDYRIKQCEDAGIPLGKGVKLLMTDAFETGFEAALRSFSESSSSGVQATDSQEKN